MNQLSIEQSMQIALGHYQAGRFPHAEQILRSVLTHDPSYVQALNLLGVLRGQLGDLNEAILFHSRAIQIQPAFAEAHNNLATALCGMKRFDEAIAAYRRAIGLTPNLPEIHGNLGDLLRRLGRLDEALASCNRSIELRNDIAQAHNNLGIVLHEKKQFDKAIAAYARAIQLQPNNAAAFSNLGNALREKGEFAAAIASLNKAMEIQPNFVIALNNLGCAFSESGNTDQAIACFEQAIALEPELADPHWNLSQELLRRGEFRRGWSEFEWRATVLRKAVDRSFVTPPWDGTELHGRPIVLCAEQGFGDAIQFVRYATMVADRGGKVILECHPDLARLLANCRGVNQVSSTVQPIPDNYAHIPLLSLPMVFGTELNSIPAPIPYITPLPADSQAWARRFADKPNRLRIGLAWAGRPTHKKNRRRSIPLAEFGCLAQLHNADLYSLQKGDAANEPRPPGLNLTDWTDSIADFADTAALIANLDLVISVDTAVAHLAGAIGKPTWLLLPIVSDWRWLMHREDSPWYPTMRLIRRKTSGDWKGVVIAVAQQIQST